MCVVCGCDNKTEILHNHEHEDEHNHEHGQIHSHVHNHENEIHLETAILKENNKFAIKNREFFNQSKTLVVNLLSSPGSGKTTLLESTIKCLLNDNNIFVIEGDQHTEIDAERIRKAGAKAYQINTGKACHLDGHMINHVISDIELIQGGYLFIENVGNLICPALFDLGEHVRVVIISVTEGDDKPLKYPDMFHSADLIIINKIDLLKQVNFSLEKCLENIRKINIKAKILEVSALNLNTLEPWIKWLKLAYVYHI